MAVAAGAPCVVLGGQAAQVEHAAEIGIKAWIWTSPPTGSQVIIEC